MVSEGLRVVIAKDDEPTDTAYRAKGNFSHVPDFSSFHQRFPSSKIKVDELFIQWLSLPESQKLVLSLLEDAKAGLPLTGPLAPGSHSPGSLSPLSPSGAQSLFGAASTPPLSPRGGGGLSFSPKSPALRHGLDFSPPGSALKPGPERASPQAIPQFYFPLGQPAGSDAVRQSMAVLDEVFASQPQGINQQAMLRITKEVCQLPAFFNGVLFRRLADEGTSLVTREAFTTFWVDPGHLTADMSARVMAALKQPDNNFLTQEDWDPLMRELLATHPGLEFLHDTPEFQERYAETVIYRIFYSVNRSGSGRMLLRELRRSNLMAALLQVEEEEDINKILKYFSYEHFYVIYCKFWELDSDHDFNIDKDDLLRYGNHALTYRIVERIFSQVPRKFSSKVEGKMGYEDFVWFILSEEDKSSEPSLEYWFKCVDMDCDGRISANEMRYFYEEQLHRMECMAQEPVLFEDVCCQMADMINPRKKGDLTLRDLKRCKLSGNFFNVLFNLNKFVAFETRDPFLIRQEREDPTLTEWDRFARGEYIRLSMEDDGEDASNGSAEVWDESLEAPF
eukprot:TRINITY_DN2323_c0_g2_i1.p1 TRINITY_DN2323_c0_g2~~TRINITY_DN2323_c0_g2_i1.p1  ORF type:complete len:564 (-),score=121.44 TRINITY_DN2323_c0_g2_i1:1380-3071(-)